MPNSALPANTYMGDGQRTTSEMQTSLDQVATWLNAAQAELNALTGTTFGEAAVRGVGTGASDLVQTSRLDTRLATTGNLGDAAQRAVGTADGNLPEYESEVVALGGDFDAGQQVKCVRVGDFVSITGVGENLTHSSSSQPASTDGVIPAFARPTNYTELSYFHSTSGVNATAALTSGGRIIMRYSLDGSLVNMEDSVTPPILKFSIT